MKILHLILIGSTIITALSCEKEVVNENDHSSKLIQLRINRNNKIYQIFNYADNELQSQINYDTMGIVIEKIYYFYEQNHITKNIYNTDSILETYQIYLLNDNQDVDTILTYYRLSDFSDTGFGLLFFYSDDGKLKTIMDKDLDGTEHLDIDFEWDGNNVNAKRFPLSSGFPQYYYEYDSNPSIYKLFNAPIDVNIARLEVAEIPMSENNISKVNVKQLINNDFTFDTVEYELYNSNFIYDEYGDVQEELRKYRNYSVVFDYEIDTLK